MGEGAGNNLQGGWQIKHRTCSGMVDASEQRKEKEPLEVHCAHPKLLVTCPIGRGRSGVCGSPEQRACTLRPKPSETPKCELLKGHGLDSFFSS